MKIVSFKICPFVQRVTAFLEAKHLKYDVEYISLKSKPQWFLDISPNGQVPVLITDSGIPLFESDAIVEYLEEVSSPIETYVSSEQRALDRAWSYMATKNYLVQCSMLRSADKNTLSKRTENFRKIFEKANNAIGKGPFFKGKIVSNVDIAWLPLLHRANIILEHTGYDLLAGYPKVQTWQKAIMKTDIVKKSVSDDFEEKFCDFYLSESTYLGTGGTDAGELDDKPKSANCC